MTGLVKKLIFIGITYRMLMVWPEVAGSKLSSRIYNGDQAPPNFAPYHAAILTVVNSVYNYKCGGAIVHTKWILTSAANCVVDEANVQVQVGSQKLANNLRKYNSSTVIIHPSFSSATAANNIALIKLTDALTLTTSVQLIALNTDPISTGTISILVGYGHLGDEDGRPNDLQAVYQKLISYTDCKTQYYPNSNNLTVGNICAYIAQQSACFGDEGSPLVSLGKDKLIGISSWIYQDTCATNMPNAVTDIQIYSSWVDATITANT